MAVNWLPVNLYTILNRLSVIKFRNQVTENHSCDWEGAVSVGRTGTRDQWLGTACRRRGRWPSAWHAWAHVGKWDYAHRCQRLFTMAEGKGRARQEQCSNHFSNHVGWVKSLFINMQLLLHCRTCCLVISAHALQPRLNDVNWWGSDDIKRTVPPPHWLIIFPRFTGGLCSH